MGIFSFLNAKSQSEDEKGVVINGVRWATRNVGAFGTFATKPEDPGMFYQWNRKKTWPATGTVTGWDKSIPVGDTWSKSNDPSPVGWRVPTLYEIKTLFDTKRVSNEMTTLNGVNGLKFTDRTTGNSLFLPAAGYRECFGGSGGTLYFVGKDGFYWSSTANADDAAYALNFGSGWDWSYGRNSSLSVRAVAK